MSALQHGYSGLFAAICQLAASDDWSERHCLRSKNRGRTTISALGKVSASRKNRGRTTTPARSAIDDL